MNQEKIEALLDLYFVRVLITLGGALGMYVGIVGGAYTTYLVIKWIGA